MAPIAGFLTRQYSKGLPTDYPKETLGIWMDITDRKSMDERLKINDPTDRPRPRIAGGNRESRCGGPLPVCGIRPPKEDLRSREEEVLGVRFDLAPEQLNEHRFLRERVMEDKAFTDLEVVRYRKDGTPVYTNSRRLPYGIRTAPFAGIARAYG